MFGLPVFACLIIAIFSAFLICKCMSIVSKMITRVKKWVSSKLKDTDPEQAYDLWAATYDAQPDNLMLALDTELFKSFLDELILENKKLIDVGCGTGRHWNEILSRKPAQITGYDVSAEMLAMLKKKFPGQTVSRLTDEHLNETDASVDLVISTLALAHIPDAAKAIKEWVRVLKPGADLIITDYHPDALQKGGNRTFRHNNQLVAVKNHIHSVESVSLLAKQLGLTVMRITERKIDASVKSWYEKKQALSVYEKFKGVPIIYGIHLKK